MKNILNFFNLGFDEQAFKHKKEQQIFNLRKLIF
jgi:hypothetical protein